jgi:hypothetical protein
LKQGLPKPPYNEGMGIVRWVILLALLPSAAGAADLVLLGSRRGGWLEAFRLDNLETVARIHVNARVESVEASPDGQRLFVNAPHPQQPEICCALWAMDPHSLRAFAILWPAFLPVLANGKVFAQRGDDGIEIFDARSLAHLPTLRVPGVYRMAPSPDGQWLFGTRQFPTPGLDIFDLTRFRMVKTFSLEGAELLRGTWLGSHYYLFATGVPGAGRFWTVDPEATSMGQPKLVRLGEPAACIEPDYDAVAAGDRLAIYSPIGTKAGCTGGGYVLIDPAAGTAQPRIAPEIHFARLIAGPDGKSLYGVTSGDAPAGEMRLVRLDAASGKVLASRTLPGDVWSISTGRIPAEWQGRLDLQAIFQ